MIRSWISLKASKLHFSLLKEKSTIFALSTGAVKSGVAVIRVSGKNSQQVIHKMSSCKTVPVPRLATLKHIYDPETREVLDKGIILWFPGPKSYTGEDMCEFQVHGSKAVIQATTSALLKIPDVRPAEPGEFTKRAFYAGKFDLTEVEGLSDLIDAETELQRKQAFYQMEGSLGNMYSSWRQSILENLARIEAFIDFSEDENIENNVLKEVGRNIFKLSSFIGQHLKDFRKGEILRDGIKTVITGSPNVGKSSLLNTLCRRPAAIVTEIAGTTRDVIQTTMNINGYPVVISDTAGIRHDKVEDSIEVEGIRRSINEAAEANLLLLILDARVILEKIRHSLANETSSTIKSYCDEYSKKLHIQNILPNTRYITVANKGDLLLEHEKEIFNTNATKNFVVISCKTEAGIKQLLDIMSENFSELCGVPSKSSPGCSRSRHRHHLSECIKYLNEYSEIMKDDNAEENVVVAAESLRNAAMHLGSLTGAIAPDEILSTIFKQFCIGK